MPRGTRHHGHPALWATLTIAVFPIVALSFGWLGMGPFQSFGMGALATILILILEAIFRRRWWMAEPAIADLLGDPSFGHKLILATGALVLVFQTLTLTAFLTSGTLDGNLLRFIAARQCDAPDNLFLSKFCRDVAVNESVVDTAAAAIRDAAETHLFPAGIVSCAAHPLVTGISAQRQVRVALVRCDRWTIGTIVRGPVATETKERLVTANLMLLTDGNYRVDGWAELDPAIIDTEGAVIPDEWNAVGGDAADRGIVKYQDLANKELILRELGRETLRRVMERLRTR